MKRRNVPLLTAIAATVVAMVLVHVRGATLPGFAALEGFAIDVRFCIRGERDPGIGSWWSGSTTQRAQRIPSSCKRAAGTRGWSMR